MGGERVMKNRTSIRAKKAGLSTVDLAMVRETARKEAEKHHDEILDQSFLYMLAIPLNVLVSDYWGDKAKDIAPGFISEVISLYEAVQQGVVDDKQLADLLDDMAGVEISSKLLGEKADAE